MMNHPPENHLRRASVIFPLLLCIVAGNAISNAATVVLDDTLDQQESNFISDIDFNESIAEVSASGGGSPFNYAFSGLGETVFSYTWQAPAGQRFVVTAPLGAASASARLRFEGGTIGALPVLQDNAPALDIHGSSGSVNVVSSRTFFTGPGAAGNRVFLFEVVFDVTPGQSFSFESVNISTTIPDSYNTDFAVTTTTSSLRGSADTASPAGQWITLEAVPEPSSSLLLALSLTCLAAHRRRC